MFSFKTFTVIFNRYIKKLETSDVSKNVGTQLNETYLLDGEMSAVRLKLLYL